MDLQGAYQFLNFQVNKVFGTYYSPPEYDLIVDRAQMSLFNDYYDEFGTSQRVNDALMPFKRSYVFTQATSPGGYITVPADYVHLLSVTTVIYNGITQMPQNRPVPVLNQDETAARDNSQIFSPSTTDPYCTIQQNWNIQLFPAVPQAGTLFYLARPVAPKFVYSIVSGRVPLYDPVASTQLQWADKDQNSILIKALSLVGINVREQDVIQYAEMKSKGNLAGTVDRL